MADKSPNELVSDPDVRALLDRRAEILEIVNKLQKEYQALGNIIKRLHTFEHPSGIQIDMEIERLKKLKKQQSWLEEPDER